MLKPKSITYRIISAVDPFEISIDLDPATLLCVSPPVLDLPWTELAYNQCSNCPLKTSEVKTCPLAGRIAPVVTALADLTSTDEVSYEVEVGTEVTFSGKATAQAIGGAVLGLLCASSGCPHTKFMRQMSWFHRPLSSKDEVMFRLLGNYLISEYFKHAEGLEADFNLSGLIDDYANLSIVNRALADRVRAGSTCDAVINAIVMLDVFTMSVPLAVKSKFKSLRKVYGING